MIINFFSTIFVSLHRTRVKYILNWYYFEKYKIKVMPSLNNDNR